MKKNTLTLSALCLLFLGSCGSKTTDPVETQPDENQQTETEAPIEELSDACMYKLVEDSTAISWTAYKFLSKAGVGGKFTEVTLAPLVDQGTFGELLNGLQFKIPTSSSNSSNEPRDIKIAEHFWANMAGNEWVQGEIIGMAGNETEGELTIKITLNEVEKEVAATYTMAETGHITINTSLDLSLFSGEPALEALNKVCEDLHKENPEEESVLWPDVSVEVKGFLAKDCPE